MVHRHQLYRMVLLFVYMLLHLIPDCMNSGTSEDVLKCFELLRLFQPMLHFHFLYIYSVACFYG